MELREIGYGLFSPGLEGYWVFSGKHYGCICREVLYICYLTVLSVAYI